MAGRMMRPHHKVRTGCAQCKSRRIKCDERKPKCSRCTRYSESCNYPTSSVDSSIGSDTSIPPPQTLSTSEQLKDLSPSTTDLTLSDLELLHQWTLYSHQGFGEGPGHGTLWREDLPRIAMQHPFMMRGILAVSALHLSRLHPESRDHYLSLASFHQTRALAAYRYLLEDLENRMTLENGQAILTFGRLTTAYAFASPHPPGSVIFAGLCSDSGVPEWLSLLRGCRKTMRDANGANFAKGFGYKHINMRTEPLDLSLNPDDHHFASMLQRFETIKICGTAGSEELKACRDALSLLRRAFSVPCQPTAISGLKSAISLWVEDVEQVYLDHLSALRPLALGILAYFCVGLKMCEGYWYINNSAERVLREIDGILGDEWREWIEWPLDRILGQNVQMSSTVYPGNPT